MYDNNGWVLHYLRKIQEAKAKIKEYEDTLRALGYRGLT